ncbi:hypothetical protein [Bacillus cereus group sp. MYBK216-1]|uniref:hypothetical protein n=1 Tax=Bacillus cereus group sp. MYBK216-1 TaxID=3450663 RepID=UPI003F78C08D
MEMGNSIKDIVDNKFINRTGEVINMKQFIISGVLGTLTFLGINSTEDIIVKTETNRSITDSKNHIIKYEET